MPREPFAETHGWSVDKSARFDWARKAGGFPGVEQAQEVVAADCAASPCGHGDGISGGSRAAGYRTQTARTEAVGSFASHGLTVVAWRASFPLRVAMVQPCRTSLVWKIGGISLRRAFP